MDKVGALLVLMGIAGLVNGCQGVYTVVTNWTPTTMDCADYIRDKPSAKWLKLENCYLDLENAYSSGFLGIYVDELLVPVRAQGTNDPTIHILLSTEGEKFEDFVKRFERMKEGEDRPADFSLENHLDLFFQERVDGLVRYGLELDNHDEDDIEDTVEHLATDWILLDDGKVPNRAEAFGMFGLGLALIAAGWFLVGQDDGTKRRPLPRAYR